MKILDFKKNVGKEVDILNKHMDDFVLKVNRDLGWSQIRTNITAGYAMFSFLMKGTDKEKELVKEFDAIFVKIADIYFKPKPED